MGETPVRKSLSGEDVKPESIITNTGLEVNSEWVVDITDREVDNTSIDQYRSFANEHKQENITDSEVDTRKKHPGRLILINHKRIK